MSTDLTLLQDAFNHVFICSHTETSILQYKVGVKLFVSSRLGPINNAMFLHSHLYFRIDDFKLRPTNAI